MKINLVLADTVFDIRLADSFLARACGLLAMPRLGEREGLLIKPCAGVHTVGMRYPIDVVFLDRDARVRRIVARLTPCRLAGCRDSRAVLELAAGSAAAHVIEVGQQLAELRECLN